MKYSFIYLYKFFGDLVPVIPLIGIYLMSNNLSLGQVSLLFLVFSLLVTTLEVPTGIISDKFKPKQVLIFSRLLKILCFTIWLLLPSFYGFLIGYVCWAIASSFDSGTYQSFLYRTVSQNGDLDKFESIYGKSMSAQTFATIIATSFIFVTPYTGYNFLVGVGVFSLFISLVLIFFIPNNEVATDTEEVGENFLTKINNFKLIGLFSNRLVIYILIGSLVGGIKGTLDEYTSILFSNSFNTIFTVGISLILIDIIRTFGTFYADKIKLDLKLQNFIMFLIGCMFMMVFIQNSILTLILIILLIFIDAILWVNNDTSIQRLANHESRATTHSAKSFLTELTSFSLLAIFSIIGASLSIGYFYLIAGALLIISSTTVFVLSLRSPRY